MNKLVFDVGASAIKYALMDDLANIYEKGSVPTPQDTLEHFLTELKNIYLIFKGRIDGIAISIPGTIDADTGQIYAPGGLAYNENVNLINEMRSFTQLPIAIENDGKSAALAELWKGNLQGCEDGVVLALGSGIGGGIIKDGKLWKGKHLFAGEFSYIMGDKADGFTDVWAMKASTTALIMNVAKKKSMDMKALDGYQIFQMIQDKDEAACEALDEVCDSIAKGIFNLQCILDPEKVLIGGGISKQPILLEKIQERLDALYTRLPFDVPHASVSTCRFYNDSNLIGALYNFIMQH